jgi:transketolase
MKKETDHSTLARRVRKHVVDMAYTSGASHVAVGLSCVDILAAVYDVARVDPKNHLDPGRDRVLLSKGHGAPALYGILAEHGFFDKALIKNYFGNDSPLMGHTEIQSVPGIENTAGSLGHGLPIGLGMALAGKIDKATYHVFVILGDGECDEGSVWEAALAASQFKLDNLIVIVDRNNQQGLGRTSDIMNLEPLDKKWESFGWHVTNVDGHDHQALVKHLQAHHGKPHAIIAKTTKGKGVSFMEDQLFWHYHNPDDKEYAAAIKEIYPDGEEQ